MLGDKAGHSLPLLYNVALKAGWVVLTANYALSTAKGGGASFPRHLHDCLRAVAWARSAEACQYGGGGRTLVVAGESAGGHLACLVGLTCETSRLHPADLAGLDLRVDGVLDLYGLHDPWKYSAELFRHAVIRRSRRDEDGMQVWNDATPMWWVEEAGEGHGPCPPPFFIVHGTHDTLIPLQDARDFHQQLQIARRSRGSRGVSDIFVEVPGALHAFNFMHSPLSYALSDSVVIFLQSVDAATSTATSKL